MKGNFAFILLFVSSLFVCLFIYCSFSLFFTLRFQNVSGILLELKKSSDTGQARVLRFVGPDLVPNCLQRLSVDETFREKKICPHLSGTLIVEKKLRKDSKALQVHVQLQHLFINLLRNVDKSCCCVDSRIIFSYRYMMVMTRHACGMQFLL